MYATQGKRHKKGKGGAGKVTKPFRAPRAAQRQVIPGLLKTRGEEKKVLYTSNTTSGGSSILFTTAGTVQALNLIQVGSSMFNRIGRRLEMLSIRLEAVMFCTQAAATAQQDYGRVAIVYDRQTNGAYPAIADIFQDTDQAGANTTTSLSGLNMNNRERFVTILDERIYLPQVTTAAGAITSMFPQDTYLFKSLLNEFRKMPKLTTHYKADSNPAVIGDISTGGLYIVSLANNAPGNNNWGMTWNCRLKYVDV